MAGNVVNMKVCNPHKLRIGLTEKCFEMPNVSYTQPLAEMRERCSS